MASRIFHEILQNLPRPPNRQERLKNRPQAPWKILKSLSKVSVGFFAWIMDAFDFFAVSVTLTRLRNQFEGKTINDLSTAITLTLLFRSLGAFVFGIITDRYGRRWPLTINLIIIALLALGTGLLETYTQFLAIRSLFGIAMGGVYGMATATSLENLPVEARGLFSGILQEGYAVGYLLAASVNLTLVEDTNNWRSIFYLGAGLSFFVALLRAICPESDVFLKAREESRLHPDPLGRSPGKIYLESLTEALKLHWGRFVFTVFLMAGFNFLSHGSQDLYPTFVQISKGMTSKDASLITIIGNCGAIIGGTISGWLSQFLGRRLTIICMIIWTAGFIPLWILPTSFSGLSLGAFFYSVIPIYLSEIAPPAFRGIFTGLSYQLGNMISSASSQIEARAGESRQINVNGTRVADYAYVQSVLIGCITVYILILTCLGKEYRGRSFDEDSGTNPSIVDEV
ncbi:MFS transporter [Phakopsora pachyrhizi]|uniref:MFS transporter n=1 Tax=Phakopsora pachyrhizi TaxID=170000 RepID=A0AAV0AFM1_PHAPC|nr:MFS transporter [Phakopsora pachyrhizi]